MTANHAIPTKKSKTPLIIVIVILVIAAVAGAAFALTQDKPTTTTTPEPAKPATTPTTTNAETAPFYVMVVGSDSRKGTVEANDPDYLPDANGSGRSDTEMIVRVDPTTYTVSLVSVPRDTATPWQGVTTKINMTFAQGGVDALKAATEELSGVSIKYTMVINFKNFEELYDSLSVTANVPIAMDLDDIVSGKEISLNAGTQLLSGPEALVLARVRKAYIPEYMDPSRQIQDRQLVQLGIEKVAADPATVDANVALLRGLVTTDWPEASMKATIEDFAKNSSKITFQSGTGPYLGEIDPSAANLWLVPRDTATWSQLMSVVDAGGDPTTVVPLPEVAAADVVAS